MPTRRTRRRRQPEIYGDPVAAAKAAKLAYVSDDQPGWSRRRRGKGFSYHDEAGATIRDEQTLARLKALAIPPAWSNVWICPDPAGHLQATGYDARGRKQYRYHERWRAARDAAKFARMLDFGHALPTIRARVAADLRQRGLPRSKVLATVVRLLEDTLIRVGNDEYARANKTYGLTTMRDRHVDVQGSHIIFKFRGKHSIRHKIELTDRRLARIVKQCRDLPGYELFQYLDDDGVRQDVKSNDVNAYLHEITGQDWTAKDFRTWAGTMLTALELRACAPCATKTAAQRTVVAAIKVVAERLGNTPSVCRSCYVHPAVIDTFMDGAMHALLDSAAAVVSDDAHALDADEQAVLHLLQTATAAAQDR